MGNANCTNVGEDAKELSCSFGGAQYMFDKEKASEMFLAKMVPMVNANKEAMEEAKEAEDKKKETEDKKKETEDNEDNGDETEGDEAKNEDLNNDTDDDDARDDICPAGFTYGTTAAPVDFAELKLLMDDDSGKEYVFEGCVNDTDATDVCFVASFDGKLDEDAYENGPDMEKAQMTLRGLSLKMCP